MNEIIFFHKFTLTYVQNTNPHKICQEEPSSLVTFFDLYVTRNIPFDNFFQMIQDIF